MQSNIKFFSADGTAGRYKGKPACGLPRGAGATACVLPYSTVKGQSPTGGPLHSLHHARRGSRRRRRIVPFSPSVTARERSDKAVIARRPKGNGAISPYRPLLCHCEEHRDEAISPYQPLKRDRHGPFGPRDDTTSPRGAGARACVLPHPVARTLLSAHVPGGRGTRPTVKGQPPLGRRNNRPPIPTMACPQCGRPIIYSGYSNRSEWLPVRSKITSACRGR